ncbi:MAG: hypothetical protein KIT84_08380 [Labilithrix sp.]|nr:hypothetical protein [Labilithrix sp.]MCW5811014.1 hypothetical protein [Labilithrix sp.]
MAIVLAAMVGVGCAEPRGEDASVAEGELGEDALNPLDEEGVLLLVNDRAVTADVLTARAGMTAPGAQAIVDYRTNADGAPRWFMELDELTALPGLGANALDELVADARANGYVEARGFEPPTSARLSIPDGLGRPPTSNDVTVEAGFDGKSPDDVVALVRSRLTNKLYSGNERFVDETVRTNHKAFTIALGNLFAPSSPTAALVNGLQADRITMLGTMSAVTPTIIMVEKAGAATYYARGEGSGAYQPIPKPRYPIIMRSRVRTLSHPEGPGVRVFYPAWSAKVLEGPTGTVIESR